MPNARDQLLLDTFVDLADTLASDYDVGELLQMLVDRCAELTAGDTAGVLLEAKDGRPTLAAATSGEMLALERLEIDLGQGPCLEAFQTGENIVVEDLERYRDRWPDVTPKIRDLGMRAVMAFPLQLRDDRIGALNVYRRRPGEFTDWCVRLGRALADMAAVGIMQQRQVSQAEQRAGQLQQALDSRVVIEQAKGVLVARRGCSPDEAFDRLRTYARRNNAKLRLVSRRVVDGELDL